MTLDEFLTSDQPLEVIRTRMRERVQALGVGGMSKVARACGLDRTDISGILSSKVRRNFSLQKMGQIMRAVKEVESRHVTN